MPKMITRTVEGKIISIEFEADDKEDLRDILIHLEGELLTLALIEKSGDILLVETYDAELKRMMDSNEKTMLPSLGSQGYEPDDREMHALENAS